jgi:hypothetical protein
MVKLQGDKISIRNAGFDVTRMEEFHPAPDEYDTWFSREPD